MPLAATTESPVDRRLGTLTLGLVLVGAGVAITIRAGVGVAPYDVLTTGFVSLPDVPVTVAAMLLPMAFVGIGLRGDRPPDRWPTRTRHRARGALERDVPVCLNTAKVCGVVSNRATG